MWYEDVIDIVLSQQGRRFSTDDGTIVVSDAKTPSGRVHVGALRGVIIHDAINKYAKMKGMKSKYLYLLDEFDPMDGSPSGAEHLKQYMGKPLFQIPSPDERYKNISDFYASDFFGVFDYLGVDCEILRARDFYQKGMLNEAIERILNHANVVREVYFEVSKAERSDNWYPFQVICESCGKVGTTEVIEFDGKEVTYTCREDMVKWAKGCSYKGKISPFDGNGKLPWKLEWGAKWYTFKVTIEGAGKDHSTKGGSRDVAEACYRRIFNLEPPLNIPYEFFLIGGAKMSSSKGLGQSASDMADLFPPEILRFLMLRTPKRTIDFDPKIDYMIKLFNEYDQLVGKYLSKKTNDSEEIFLRLSSIDDSFPQSEQQNFQLLYALSQMPHLDVVSVIKKRAFDAGTPVNDMDVKHLQDRLKTVYKWIESFLSLEDRIVVQTELSEKYEKLSQAQKAFLKNLEALLIRSKDRSLGPDDYQGILFDAARLTPISASRAFEAFYALLINKSSGPKGGALIYYLGLDKIINLLQKANYDEKAYLEEVAITEVQYNEWINKQSGKDSLTEEKQEEKLNDFIIKIVESNSKIYKQIIKI